MAKTDSHRSIGDSVVYSSNHTPSVTAISHHKVGWRNCVVEQFGERNARIKAQSNAMTIPINFKPQLIFFGMKNVFASPESAFATFHATIDPNQGGGGGKERKSGLVHA